MISTQYINLDMTPSGVLPVLYCSQYDVGRPLGFVVHNGGEAVDLSTYTCTIEATRTDVTAITAAVTTDGNVGEFSTTATMTNVTDRYPAKLVIVDGDGNRVASLAFVMCVTPATMDENAESIEEDASLYQQYTETVQSQIATERQLRISADDTLQNNISAEASARAAGDSRLSEAINAEASARAAGDSHLSTAINAEAATRAAQDASLQSQIDQIIAPSGEAPSAAEVQNARIGVNGVVYDALGSAIREQVGSLRSAVSQVITDLGGDVAYTIVMGKSISANVGGLITFLDSENRMYITFTAYNDFTITNNYENGVRMAFITGGADGKCVANTGWSYLSIGHVTANPDYTYYILCDYTDTTKLPTLSYDGGAVEDVGENERMIKFLEYDMYALKNGYYGAVPLSWESGSFNIPSGTDKNPDINVIRTSLPRVQLNGNIRVLIKNDKYRFRCIGAVDQSSPATFDSGWHWGTSGSYDISIDPTMYYRIQIATKTAASMDMEDALQSLIIVYVDDSMSDIKPFWDTYIENKVQSINGYLKDGSSKTAFLFLTDTHWNGSLAQLNHYGINTALMKYVADKCNVEYVIHGGDLNSEYRSDINIARELMTEPMSMMEDAFEHVLVTRGNHDDNNESGNRNWSYTISQADSYSYMFRNTKDVVFGETGTYFYHDIPFEKVRIISLDCVDFPYTNNVDETLLDEKFLAYGYTQLQWLCDVLKNTPSGYHIVIYTHAMIAPSSVTVEHPNDSPQTRALNFSVVARILQAYKNRVNFTLNITGWFTAINQSYFDGILRDDFTSCGATIVGVFSGHEHIDCIEEIEVEGVGIGIYNTCTQNSSAMFGSSVISSTYQHPMEIGTTSELVWDMVVIDRKTKHVDMIRIGANGANTDVEEVNVRSFDYT